MLASAAAGEQDPGSTAEEESPSGDRPRRGGASRWIVVSREHPVIIAVRWDSRESVRPIVAVVSPTRYELDPESSQVWIDGSSTVHPLHSTATGLTGWVELSVSDGGPVPGSSLDGEVRVEVDRLESGNPLVDRETRRRIDARHYPKIVGSVVSARMVEDGTFSVTGDIAFRGETSRVDGTINVSVEGSEVVLEGSQRFDVRYWSLQPPKLMMVRVHPEVNVRIRLVGRRADTSGAG